MIIHGHPVAVRDSRLARAGFTLVELLVAMALTLILILAMTQVFVVISRNVTGGRALLEMSGQLRSAADRLQKDLEGLTVPVRPWPEPGSALGYFEYVEGIGYDSDPDNDGILGFRRVPADDDTAVGDIDDLLMFTATSHDAPFLGQVLGRLIPPAVAQVLGRPYTDGRIEVLTNQADGDYQRLEDPALFNPPLYTANQHYSILQSTQAEIVWWLTPDDKNGDGLVGPGENWILHRRALLIRPDLVFDRDPFTVALPRNEFFNANDVSVRYEVVNNALLPFANSLSDLTDRRNRFAHILNAANPPSGFPFPIDATLLRPKVDWTPPLTVGGYTYFCEQQGVDTIASQVLAFDVRVFDPAAEVRGVVGSADAYTPGDPAFANPVIAPQVLGQGAYVDLYYSREPGLNAFTSVFSGPPQPRSQLDVFVPATYDTWSYYYEHDGVDQDNDMITDEGTDGIDNDGTFGVDDVAERETSPPYPFPLRGIQVRIRMIEPDTHQVRQVTVSQDMTPE